MNALVIALIALIIAMLGALVAVYAHSSTEQVALRLDILERDLGVKPPSPAGPRPS